MQTTIQTLITQHNKCRNLADMHRASDPSAGREFSLAATALEDAMMRFNRGMAYFNGTFSVADLEKV